MIYDVLKSYLRAGGMAMFFLFPVTCKRCAMLVLGCHLGSFIFGKASSSDEPADKDKAPQ